jgi:hypothetical protein
VVQEVQEQPVAQREPHALVVRVVLGEGELQAGVVVVAAAGAVVPPLLAIRRRRRRNSSACRMELLVRAMD